MRHGFRQRFESVTRDIRDSATQRGQEAAERLTGIVLQQVSERPELFERVQIAQQQLVAAKSDISLRGAGLLDNASQRLSTLEVPTQIQTPVSTVSATFNALSQRLRRND